MRFVKLGDIAQSTAERGGQGTSIPVYSVTKHEGFVRSDEYFKKQVFSRDLSNYKLVREGHFAYATIHLDEGSVGVAPEDSLVSPMYTSFETNTNTVCSDYLIRFLKSPRALASYPSLGKGSAERRRSISFARLAELRIPLPPLREQQRIAAILDKADELRTKRRQAIAHLDTLTQSIFREVDVQTQAASRVKLSEVCSRIQTGPFGSLLHKEDYVDGGIPLVNPMHIRHGKIVADSSFSITPSKFSELSGYRLLPGDVVIGRRGEIGRSAEVLENHGPLLCGTGSLIARPSPQRLLPTYLVAVLTSQSTRRRLIEVAQGATMLNLNTKIVGNLEVPLPPIELQQTFATRVAAVERLKESHRKHLAELDTLFASLQHRAFKGEL